MPLKFPHNHKRRAADFKEHEGDDQPTEEANTFRVKQEEYCETDAPKNDTLAVKLSQALGSVRV